MSTLMKAAAYKNYGGPEVLQLVNIEKPIPGSGEILIKVHATAVNSADCRLRQANPPAVRLFFGLFRPKKQILGDMFSGEIVAMGNNTTRFRVGDTVFGSTSLRFGAYAAYVCLPENGVLALKPANINFAEAAAIPFGANTAYHFLRKANIQNGQKVLVYGASGAVGSAAVQIAKSMGAEVTAVCSTTNIDLMRSIGADHVIDYTQSDFAQAAGVYDVVYETVNKASVAACCAMLKPKGTLILGAAMGKEALLGLWTCFVQRKKLIAGVALDRLENLLHLKEMVEAGHLKPIIDRQFPLDQIVEAHRYVDSGHKKGNVVLNIG